MPKSEVSQSILEQTATTTAILFLCVICALLQLHLLHMASGNLQNDLPDWIKTVQGAPNWPGYRSRLLGVGLIMLFGGDIRAYMEVTGVALTLAGLLAWRLNGAEGLAILHAGFAVFANPWFSPWDMFEPAIFLAFAILVVERWHSLWLMGLFAVAIFNLQSAMFIAGWMVLAGMWRSGLMCIAFGLAVMWYFQHTDKPHFGFYIFQCADRMTTGHGTDYAQERLMENLHKLLIFDNRAVMGVIAVLGFSALRMMREQFTLGLTFLAMLSATVVFGIVDEMRVYLPFIPLLILAAR